MGILEMDFERILGVPFFIVVLIPSCCGRHADLGEDIGDQKSEKIVDVLFELLS